MPASTVVSIAQALDDPQRYEDEHVHSVYDKIAPHFSSTRYKPWPIIEQFLSSIPTGWVGLDSGTGNGKYLTLPLDRPGSVWTIGLDRSRNLLEIARSAGGVLREVLWGNVLDGLWRDGAFDYAISVATIHHLSTHVRRKVAVQRLLQCINPSHGRALIYVWAVEQDELSKRTIPPAVPAANSTFQDDTVAKGRDVFVPWVLSSQPQPQAKLETKGTRDSSSANSPETSESAEQQEPKVYNRYYHMFTKGELSELVRNAATEQGLMIGSPPAATDFVQRPSRGVEIVQDGWERSNYYVELRCWNLRAPAR